MTNIAYLGLGNMGAEIATHLSTSKDANLTVWNRSQDKYDGLRAHMPNATFAKSLDELSDAQVIFLSLLNDQVSSDMVGNLIKIVGQGTIIIDQSSVNPKTSIANEKAAKAAGVIYLAAPVFGRPDAAKAGKLIQVVSGDAGAQEKVKPLFKCFTRAVLDVGHEVYKASTFKLMGNALIIGVIELLAETYTLGDAAGIDPDVFQEFVDLFFPTPSYQAYGRKIGHENYSSAGGFRLAGGLKDARNILSAGADLGHPVPMPTIAIAKEHMEKAEELGGPDMDWSSLAAAVRIKAGLEPFREKDGSGSDE